MLPLHQAGIQNEGPRITRKQLIERIEPKGNRGHFSPEGNQYHPVFPYDPFPCFWMQNRETEFACG